MHTQTAEYCQQQQHRERSEAGEKGNQSPAVPPPGCSPSPSWIISTKLDGKTPILPFSDPSHQPSSTCNISICINPLLTSTVLLQHPTSASTLSSLPLCCFNTQHQHLHQPSPHFHCAASTPNISICINPFKIHFHCATCTLTVCVHSLCEQVQSMNHAMKPSHLRMSTHCVTTGILGLPHFHLSQFTVQQCTVMPWNPLTSVSVNSLCNNIQSCHETISPLSLSIHCVTICSHAMKPSHLCLCQFTV